MLLFVGVFCVFKNKIVFSRVEALKAAHLQHCMGTAKSNPTQASSVSSLEKSEREQGMGG